jgi:PKD repeat protein
MFKGIPIRLRLMTLLVVTLVLAPSVVPPAFAAHANGPTLQGTLPGTVTAQSRPNPYFTVETVTFKDGSQLERMTINGPAMPPPGYEVNRTAAPMLAGDVLLPVPAYNWVFGCSAVSASMVAAYLDRNGLSNMYTGPTNGGVMPMDNSTWPTWTDVNGSTYPGNPLTASRNGLDGRTTRGSIDDYWVYYNSDINLYPDPYITNGWTQHPSGDAVGDYMWTSQSSQGNTDGATSFWGYSSASKLSCATMESGNYDDGTVGRKHFYEARGYSIPAAECYNQKTDNQVAGGFSFATYKAKIDAGYPVFLNLVGHSIVGVGYNDTTTPPTVYLNDTWNWTSGTTHSMPWGGSYSGMALVSVSIADPVLPTTAPAAGISDVSVAEGNSGTTNANFAVNLSAPASSTVTVSYATVDGTAAAGQDYTATSGVLTFLAGETLKAIAVPVIGDTAVETNETFFVNLSLPTGGLNITDNQGVGTIVNDDQLPNQPPVAVISASPTSGYAPLTVNFSGSGSSDADGSIASYSWKFGDGSSGTGTTVSHTYASVGAYTAVLTVTDNRGGTGTASVGITTSQNPAKVIRVSNIAMTKVTSGRNRSAKAVITVTNLSGQPVANATVNATWSGLVTGNVSAKTNSSGQVSFTSKTTTKSGSITITVRGITPPTGYTYDASKNTMTSASVTF